MKYLKRFNEELKPSTYMSAAKKLAAIGHTGRANALKDWANETEKREEIVKWKDRLQDYGLFGTYKMNIVNPETEEKFTGDFYLDVNFDELGFEDNFESEKENNPDLIKGVYIFFFIGLIPTTEETLRKCEEIMPEPEFGNGMFWGMTCGLEFEVVKNEVILKNFTLEDYDDNLSGKVSFADRASAGKFKNLLKSIFSNPELNYPSGYTDVEYMYQKLEQVILIRQGFSSDYGFELNQVADFINTQSPNTMYKTI
jgi:hypothetical protein